MSQKYYNISNMDKFEIFIIGIPNKRWFICVIVIYFLLELYVGVTENYNSSIFRIILNRSRTFLIKLDWNERQAYL